MEAPCIDDKYGTTWCLKSCPGTRARERFVRYSMGPGSVRRFWLLPQALEPVPGNPGVIGRVLGVAVAKIVLHGAEVSAPVGQVVPAAVPEHVRPYSAEFGLLAGKAGNV